MVEFEIADQHYEIEAGEKYDAKFHYLPGH